MSAYKNARDHCGGGGIGDIDPDIFAGYFDYCNLLYPCFGNGDRDCKIYIRSDIGMQIVVVRAPKMLRGLLMKIFKIHS